MLVVYDKKVFNDFTNENIFDWFPLMLLCEHIPTFNLTV